MVPVLVIQDQGDLGQFYVLGMQKTSDVIK